MTQKTSKVLKMKVIRNHPERILLQTKHIDDIWSLDILDLKEYGPENNEGYRYVSVLNDSFSNFGWINLLKKCSNNKRLF